VIWHEPPERVHEAGLAKASSLVAEKSTVPVGVVAAPVSVSDTTAVQVAVSVSSIEEGVQLTEVEVERSPALRVREESAEAVPNHNAAAAATTDIAPTARIAPRLFSLRERRSIRSDYDPPSVEPRAVRAHLPDSVTSGAGTIPVR
jgi:hypothetical protein